MYFSLKYGKKINYNIFHCNFAKQNYLQSRATIYYNFAMDNEYLISQLYRAEFEQNFDVTLVSEQNFGQNKRFLRALPAGRIILRAEFIQA